MIISIHLAVNNTISSFSQRSIPLYYSIRNNLFLEGRHSIPCDVEGLFLVLSQGPFLVRVWGPYVVPENAPNSGTDKANNTTFLDTICTLSLAPYHSFFVKLYVIKQGLFLD